MGVNFTSYPIYVVQPEFASALLHDDVQLQKPQFSHSDGVDSYVTPEGYVFAAPRASSLYVPVVTGAYRPPFPASFVGSVRGHIDLERAKIDKRIAELEREKYPFFRRELQNDRNISAKKGCGEK